jgi:hypothetical protein
MARRYYCNIEGLEANWIEVSERWTRREAVDYGTGRGTDHEFLWLRRKVVACHLVKDEVSLTDPEALAPEWFDDADLRLWGFVCGVLGQTLRDLRTLGNMSGRLWLPTTAVALNPANPS